MKPSLQKIAIFLGRFPRIKFIIKAIYVRFVYCLMCLSGRLRTAEPVISIMPSSFETFFGYYDESPLSGDLKHCAFHLSRYSTKQKPKLGSRIDICISSFPDLSLPKAKFSSSSFNWQQGSRLHWLNNDFVLFNDVLDGKHALFSGDIKDSVAHFFSFYPIQSLSPDKNLFSSLSYSRLLDVQPEYGYFNGKTVFPNNNSSSSLYFLKIDTPDFPFSTITLDDCIRLSPNTINTESCFNHVLFSPDSLSCVFLVRTILPRMGRVDHFFSYSLVTEELRLLLGPSLISHFCFLDSNTIFGYFSVRLGLPPSFSIINISSSNITIVDELKGFGDGHPTRVTSSSVIFDSYPDSSCIQDLFLVSNLLVDDKVSVVKLASFDHPFRFSLGSRCDLHPRYCGNNLVSFDTVHYGVRSLSFMKFV